MLLSQPCLHILPYCAPLPVCLLSHPFLDPHALLSFAFVLCLSPALLQIAAASGEVSEEERVVLEARRGELVKELEEASAMEKGLAAQAKAVKEELRSASRRQASLASQLGEVQSRLDELVLQNKTAEEGLRAAVREREEAMVQHDLLKLEVTRLRDALSSRADEVFSLENRSAQLAMSIDARKREVEAERVVQRAAAKLAEEERHRLALDVGERTAKIELLKARYEAMVARMRPSGEAGPDGAGSMPGEEHSQAYYILQAAQKREELQREGDELDAAIVKSEREVKALTAALAHLTSRNHALREAFHKADPGSDEAGAVVALEARLKDAADLLFRRKKELAALQARMEEGASQLSTLEERVASLRGSQAALETSARRVEAERAAQAGALHVASDKVAAARRRVRVLLSGSGRGGSAASGSRPASADLSAGGGGESYCAEEIAFVAQGVRECSSSVLFTLGQLAREFPQLRGTLTAAMDELGLKMPTKPPPRSAVTASGAVLAGSAAATPMHSRPGSAAVATGHGGGPGGGAPVTLIGAPTAGTPVAGGGAFPARGHSSRGGTASSAGLGLGMGDSGRPMSGASVASAGSAGSLGSTGRGSFAGASSSGGAATGSRTSAGINTATPSRGGLSLSSAGTAGMSMGSGIGGVPSFSPLVPGAGAGASAGSGRAGTAGSGMGMGMGSRPGSGPGPAGPSPLSRGGGGGGSTGGTPRGGSAGGAGAGGFGISGSAVRGAGASAGGSRPTSATSAGRGSAIAAAGLSLVGNGFNGASGSAGGGSGSRPGSGRSAGPGARLPSAR